MMSGRRVTKVHGVVGGFGEEVGELRSCAHLDGHDEAALDELVDSLVLDVDVSCTSPFGEVLAPAQRCRGVLRDRSGALDGDPDRSKEVAEPHRVGSSVVYGHVLRLTAARGHHLLRAGPEA